MVIAGPPNAGKSSLFNALAGADRAIVSATPGTTRDLVTARVVLGDHVVELVDTAGLRASDDAVEQEGVRRADQALLHADLAIVALDGSREIDDEDRSAAARVHGNRVVVVTKADLPAAWPVTRALDLFPPPAAFGAMDADARTHATAPLSVSARTGVGIAELLAAIVRSIGGHTAHGADPIVTNERHRTLLGDALSHIRGARTTFDESAGTLPEEFVAADVQLALGALEEVTGRRTADDLLHEIFAKFCIGK